MREYSDENAQNIFLGICAFLFALTMLGFCNYMINNQKLQKEAIVEAKILLKDGGGLFYADGNREEWLYPLEKAQIAFDAARNAKEKHCYYTITCRVEPNEYGIGYVKVCIGSLTPKK